MSEFGMAKGEAERYATEHPEQVKAGEKAVAGKLGMGSGVEQRRPEHPAVPRTRSARTAW
jgi:hypothetical protein